jgi:signal peptidase I
MRLKDNINGKSIVLFLILATVVRAFVHSSTGFYSVVCGLSMYPTFKPDDVVQTRSADACPERGDVVIITDDLGERVMKRIIGLPGETVTLRLGFVYINGQRLSEPYLPKLTYTFLLDNQETGGAAWRLGKNQFFVLGDNRLRSIDSRNFGPVERHRIRRFVNLPENTVRPGFSDIILSGSGMPMRQSRIQREEAL